jgi:hypothetical protein
VLGFVLGACASSDAQARLLPGLKSRAPRSETARAEGLPTDAELEAGGARIGAIRFQTRGLFDVDRDDDNTALARKCHAEVRS